MAIGQSKTNTKTEIQITGRDGRRKGKITITNGYVIYRKKGSKSDTAKLTPQQLASLLEEQASDKE